MNALIDLEPEERELHRLLSAAPPTALPFGFRDAVMTRVRGDRRVGWEWIVAVLFALPSLVFLVWQILVHGDDFARAISNIVTAASTETGDAFFFVDGLTIVALALLGLACAVAAHALFVSSGSTRTLSR
ncbi:MAG TPA: hypothetical protein VFC31_03790 [Candidatus Limnocylindria bacterium]|nr:hypothetical protein [Candidatus Limnocylindria bacterium]